MSTLAIATPQSAAGPTDILRFLREHPLTAIGESILRVIAGMFYQEGICWAAQRTIAKAAGCGKSSVMRELDELEALGLIRRIARTGTSHMIQLASGLVEALREMRINRREAAQRMRGIPKIAASFPEPVLPPALDCTAAAPIALPAPVPILRGRFSAEPEEPVSRKALPQNVVHTTNGAKAPTEPRIALSTVTNLDIPKKLSPCPTAKEYDGAIKIATEKLVHEGVTPSRARSFASLFDFDRIVRNIQAGLHRAKNNPPGYLITAITHDFAASRINPNSEAAAVFEREHGRKVPEKTVLSPQFTTTEIAQPPINTTPPPPSLEEEVSQRFAVLNPEERTAYERRAEEQLRATIGNLAGHGTAFQAMTRARARALFQREHFPVHSP